MKIKALIAFTTSLSMTTAMLPFDLAYAGGSNGGHSYHNGSSGQSGQGGCKNGGSQPSNTNMSYNVSRPMHVDNSKNTHVDNSKNTHVDNSKNTHVDNSKNTNVNHNHNNNFNNNNNFNFNNNTNNNSASAIAKAVAEAIAAASARSSSSSSATGGNSSATGGNSSSSSTSTGGAGGSATASSGGSATATGGGGGQGGAGGSSNVTVNVSAAGGGGGTGTGTGSGTGSGNGNGGGGGPTNNTLIGSNVAAAVAAAGNFGSGGGGGAYISDQAMYQGGNFQVAVAVDTSGASEQCVYQDATVVKAIHAECVSADGRSFPASHMLGATWLDAAYEGEVMRCIPGSSLHVTVGEVVQSDQGMASSFTNGQQLNCAEHEALRHYKDGMLKCAIAVPVPDCTERTNLRRWGTGDMFFSYRTRVCAQTHREYSETSQQQQATFSRETSSESSSGELELKGMQLDGGAGTN